MYYDLLATYLSPTCAQKVTMMRQNLFWSLTIGITNVNGTVKFILTKEIVFVGLMII